jgi:zinc transport system ATP-binding protein
MIEREIAIRFNSVSFSYGEILVLEKASFHIHKGEFVAMVGPNGSGKTTVIKLLFGLVPPAGGSIELFGSNLAYVPQHLPADQMFPITVKGIVRMGLLRPLSRYANEDSAIALAMEQAGIEDIAAKPYSSLSGGQKRRTLVARALAAKPDILVLDEPTANMDSESEKRLYETLARYKGETTILIVTHDTEFVTSLTDRVLCLGDGSRTVVQHRVEQAASGRHGNPVQEARVLHGESIPADACCTPNETGKIC